MSRLWELLKWFVSLFAAYRKGVSDANTSNQQLQQVAADQRREQLQKALQTAQDEIVRSYSDPDLRRRMREQCTVHNPNGDSK